MDMYEDESESMLTAVISQRDGGIAVTQLDGGSTATTTDIGGGGARWTVGRDAVMRDGDDVFKW